MVSASDSAPLETPDGRYIIVNGRLWRKSNPALQPDKRDQIVKDLMTARRDVGAALKVRDEAEIKSARSRVHEAKVALGERGPVWWVDGVADYGRRLVKNTPYAAWFANREK